VAKMIDDPGCVRSCPRRVNGEVLHGPKLRQEGRKAGLFFPGLPGDITMTEGQRDLS
jgi:hypothetical protein